MNSVASPMVDPALQAIYEMVEGNLVGARTFQSVVTGVVVWEYLTTIHLEWRAIWSRPKKFTFLNLCFLFTRYGILAYCAALLYLEYWPNRTAEDCDHLYMLPIYGQTCLYFVSGIIIVARVYAIWERNKSVLVGMSALLVTMFAVMLWAPHAATSQFMFPGLQYCIPSSDIGAENYWIYYMMAIIFDAVSLLAVSWKLTQIWRAGGRSNLTWTLLRDQYLFFALTFATGLCNLIYYLVTPPSGVRILISTLSLSMQCISVCRMWFNIRTVPVGDATLSHTSQATSRSAMRSILSCSNGHAVDQDQDRSLPLQANATRKSDVVISSFPEAIMKHEQSKDLEKGEA